MEVGGRAWGRIITQTRDKRVEDSSCLGADKQCGQAARVFLPVVEAPGLGLGWARTWAASLHVWFWVQVHCAGAVPRCALWLAMTSKMVSTEETDASGEARVWDGSCWRRGGRGAVDVWALPDRC